MNQTKYKYAFAAIALGLLCSFTLLQPGSWKINEEKYSIKFATKGATGMISGLKGTIQFDEANLSQSHFDVSVDVNTINTGNGMKNKHAKGEDFLDVIKYPTLSFVSEKIEKSTGGFKVTGKLTIKDVSKEVVIPFTYSGSGAEGTFNGKFEFNREDFNLERKGIGEIIKMELFIPVKK